MLGQSRVAWTLNRRAFTVHAADQHLNCFVEFFVTSARVKPIFHRQPETEVLRMKLGTGELITPYILLVRTGLPLLAIW